MTMKPQKKNGNRPDIVPKIIDTCLVGFEPGGTPVYVSGREAGLAAIASCILRVFDHPHQALQGLMLASVAAGTLYLVYDALCPVRRPVRRRQ
jgi:hypothetical protein